MESWTTTNLSKWCYNTDAVVQKKTYLFWIIAHSQTVLYTLNNKLYFLPHKLIFYTLNISSSPRSQFPPDCLNRRNGTPQMRSIAQMKYTASAHFETKKWLKGTWRLENLYSLFMNIFICWRIFAYRFVFAEIFAWAKTPRSHQHRGVDIIFCNFAPN